MSTHTPGPWELSDVHPTRVQCEGRGEEIVDTRYATEKSPSERIANARLIAAAPDLLAACKNYYDGGGDWSAEICAAIRKAEGR